LVEKRWGSKDLFPLLFWDTTITESDIRKNQKNPIQKKPKESETRKNQKKKKNLHHLKPLKPNPVPETIQFLLNTLFKFQFPKLAIIPVKPKPSISYSRPTNMNPFL